MNRKLRVMISGGGTGGHIFPAISIADALMKANPDTEILFVGARGRMEMERVPLAGYDIVALPISGIQRRLSLKNVIEDLKVPFRMIASLYKAGRIIRKFKPDVVVGVGGYASAPLLFKASSMSIPTLIQEQNGFAGLTNRLLAKRVSRICVAYENMERFFPADKIVISGNPIRSSIHRCSEEEKLEYLRRSRRNPEKKLILIVGGSLGAGTLNRAVMRWIEEGRPGGSDIELIWQFGKFYKDKVNEFLKGRDKSGIECGDFISDMDRAYAMADVIVSRAGASSVSEICAAGKAAIFVPSPNVAEDHQTHNAMALVRKGAAVMVKDSEAEETLMARAIELAGNPDEVKRMEDNAFKLAKPGAADTIVEEIYKLVI